MRPDEELMGSLMRYAREQDKAWVSALTVAEALGWDLDEVDGQLGYCADLGWVELSEGIVFRVTHEGHQWLLRKDAERERSQFLREHETDSGPEVDTGTSTVISKP